MNDRVRDELARRAEAVDVSAAARERVFGGVRPRRWAKPVLGASIAVAATVAGIAVVTRDAPTPEVVDPGPDPAQSSPTRAEDPVEAWRDESWQGVTVSVPADWGWDGSLIDGRTLCQGPVPEQGYVGRPIALTDLCQTYAPGTFPGGREVPYVWLGAPLPPGEVDLPGSWVEETVEVFGTTVTMATDDDELRARILASARSAGPCAPALDGPPQPDASFTREGTLGMQPDELTVCAYREEGDGIGLVYATRLDERAEEVHDAMLAADGRRGRCSTERRAREWVVLRVSGQDAYGGGRIFRQDVVHLASVCPRLESLLQAHPLTPGFVRTWAVEGIPFVLYGPTGGKGAMLNSFIGPLG